MSWRRISAVALALLGVWSSAGAQPAAPDDAGPPKGRTTTRLKPRHSLGVEASADAGAGANVDSQASGDAGVDAAPLAPVNEPPPVDDLPPVDEIPPPPEKQTRPKPVLAPGVRAYGRTDPLLPHVRLDAHVALTWEGAFGVGVRADWLLIEGTFKYSARDELAISAGADVTFVRFDGAQVIEAFPTAVLQWSIGVDDRLFFYPELGFLGHVDDGKWDGLYPNIGFGTRYYFARSVGMHARFGWPIAFSAGAVF